MRFPTPTPPQALIAESTDFCKLNAKPGGIMTETSPMIWPSAVDVAVATAMCLVDVPDASRLYCVWPTSHNVVPLSEVMYELSLGAIVAE